MNLLYIVLVLMVMLKRTTAANLYNNNLGYSNYENSLSSGNNEYLNSYGNLGYSGYGNTDFSGNGNRENMNRGFSGYGNMEYLGYGGHAQYPQMTSGYGDKEQDEYSRKLLEIYQNSGTIASRNDEDEERIFGFETSGVIVFSFFLVLFYILGQVNGKGILGFTG